MSNEQWAKAHYENDIKPVELAEQQVGEVQSSREQFEVWATKHGLSLITGRGDYHFTETRHAWSAWQAALAARQPGAHTIETARALGERTIASVKLIGTLADLPEHVQKVVRSYAGLCVRSALLHDGGQLSAQGTDLKTEIADALDCFWNPAVEAVQRASYHGPATGSDVVGAIAQGLAAVAERLRS